jgi:hypothetical protein
VSDLVAFANERFTPVQRPPIRVVVALVVDFGSIATLEPRQRETNACNRRNIVAVPMGCKVVASERATAYCQNVLLVHPGALGAIRNQVIEPITTAPVGAVMTQPRDTFDTTARVYETAAASDGRVNFVSRNAASCSSRPKLRSQTRMLFD